MMLKPTSSSWIRWSYLAMIPVLAAFMFACNSPRNNKSSEQEVAATDSAAEQASVQEPTNVAEQDTVSFSSVEVKPSFNGGDSNEFSKWVNSQLSYPKQAIEDKVQGRVTLQFTIGTDGVISNVKVLRGVREDLDAEAVRIVTQSPKWEPGYNAAGKPVPVTFIFPIVFKLR